MVILVVGTPDSGKSEHAEQLISELAGNHSKLYIATMVPYGEEGATRIEKHRAMREGKDFETIECPNSIHMLKAKLSEYDSPNLLLECMSNLVGNEMYLSSNRNLSDTHLADYIFGTVRDLCTCAENVVIVTNEFEQEDTFDDETIRYVTLIHDVNIRLREFADRTHEIIDGSWIISNN
ncbi:MAG: bifunctional adenosylcobinamide kinase/adenosylcobinamide-phosphate guanylyltransferase [Eubacterium sp.]|nr:bifunctional adenosylcobinamide kinase/adenosylcobinamide-phosphate guanylyltransferase [Eubacterium sp.]